MKTTPFPTFAFLIWADGCADLYCANDKDLPITKVRRLWHHICGHVKAFLFSWWWWV